MPKVISTLAAQFKSFFNSLPPVKRNVMIVSLLITLAGILIVASMASKTSYSPLFTNISPNQMPSILERLRKKNIPFKVGDGGREVLVPGDLLPATQMAIMSEMGNSSVGTLGLGLFDKEGFGVSSYVQRINYQRALQGELIRAIDSLSAVRQSKVLLTLPKHHTFLDEDNTQPTASVVVQLYPGKYLTPPEVNGITHLVASAVQGLDPSKVTVVDDHGRILSKNYSGEAGVTSEVMDIEQQDEQRLEDKIESMLTPVVGQGKVVAQVNVTLDPQSMSSVSDMVNPDQTAVRSEVDQSQTLAGQRLNPTGVPGAQSNLPGAQPAPTTGFQQNVKKELKTINYDVPHTVTKVNQSAGSTIKRISVAVLVDGTTVAETGKNGAVVEKWVPRTPQELSQYQAIVENAIGYSAKRGDSVTIQNIQFTKEDFTQSQELLTSLDRQKILRALFKWSILGSSFLLFFFVIVKPFMRWITDSFQDTVEDMLPRTIEELEELQTADNTLPGMSGALPVLEESIDPNKAESELLKERIMGIMENDIEKSAAAFNLWVSKRES